MNCFETFQAILHCRLARKGICVYLSFCWFFFFSSTMFEGKFLQETNMSANNTCTGSFMTLLVFYHGNSISSPRVCGGRAGTKASLWYSTAWEFPFCTTFIKKIVSMWWQVMCWFYSVDWWREGQRHWNVFSCVTSANVWNTRLMHFQWELPFVLLCTRKNPYGLNFKQIVVYKLSVFHRACKMNTVWSST